MKIGRIGGFARRVGKGARKLRNRAGQFAFTGGKKRKLRAVKRLAGMKLKGVAKKAKVANAKADAWLAAHPNGANAIFVASLAAGGYGGLKIGEAFNNARNKKKK
jgi:hypothetical protein